MKAVAHNFDMYSDWMYLFTVPAYHTTIKILLVFFIVLPIIPIIFISDRK